MVPKFISVAYGLLLAFCHLVFSGVNRPGSFCLEPACCACGPGCSRSPGRPSEHGVFRGAERLIICPGRRCRPEGRWRSSRGDRSQVHWAPRVPAADIISKGPLLMPCILGDLQTVGSSEGREADDFLL